MMRSLQLFFVLATIMAGCAAPPPPPPALPPPVEVPPPPPAPALPSLEAAPYGTLEEFTQVLRATIERRDFAALRQLMAASFSSGFVGPSSVDIAFAAWRSENYRSLDEAIALLDGALVAQGGNLWVAPAEYRTQAGFRGLRLGIGRGTTGRWEWLFLVRGEGR